MVSGQIVKPPHGTGRVPFGPAMHERAEFSDPRGAFFENPVDAGGTIESASLCKQALKVRVPLQKANSVCFLIFEIGCQGFSRIHSPQQRCLSFQGFRSELDVMNQLGQFLCEMDRRHRRDFRHHFLFLCHLILPLWLPVIRKILTFRMLNCGTVRMFEGVRLTFGSQALPRGELIECHTVLP